MKASVINLSQTQVSGINFRSVVMKRAAIIMRKEGKTWSESLKSAWAAYRNYKAIVLEEIAQLVNDFDYTYNYREFLNGYDKYHELLRIAFAGFPKSWLAEVCAANGKDAEVFKYVAPKVEKISEDLVGVTYWENGERKCKYVPRSSRGGW